MLTAAICDRASDIQLLDVSQYATKKVSPRMSRPTTAGITLAGDTPGLWDTSYDGRPNLEVGTRTLKIWQDGALRANTIIWNWSGSADANSSSIDVTGIDPLILTLRRPVRDATGAMADPVFPSPASGAEILQFVFQNSISNSGDPGDQEGPLPIDLSGPIASSTDLAADWTNWPISIADLITTLTATGDLDLMIFPQDTHTGAVAGVLGQLWAADHLGQDLSGSVHFDFATGDFTIQNLRRSFDMSSMANKLWYFLGGRYDSRHFVGNITATETTPVDLSAYQALQVASQALYGTSMDVQIHDDNDNENAARKMWHQIWKTEVVLRTKPRELVYITPTRGDANSHPAPAFRPFIDYNIGDTITANAAALVGPAFSGAQRIYGFDVTEDTDGVETVSELIVSLDGIGSIG